MEEQQTYDIGYQSQEKKTILVVDDDPTIVSVIFDALSDDYKVIGAKNGREGLEKAEKLKPDLVLMDVMMPDMGGYEAVRKLGSGDNTRKIPVIMVTAMDFDPSTVELLQNEPNVTGFLPKPFRAKQLRETVKARLS